MAILNQNNGIPASSYTYTELDAQNYTICKKLIFHKFSGLSKDLFKDYIKSDSEAESDIKEIGIVVEGDDIFIPFINVKAATYEEDDINSSLHTYPEKYDKYGKEIEEWNKVFKEEESDNDYELKTKVYDVKKKYTNELKSITLSTAEKEHKPLQESYVGCVNCGELENCLYLVLNDGCYEIVCGGLSVSDVRINDNDYRVIIPSSAILNMNVNCGNNSGCSNCQCNCNGKCCLFKIDLINCYYYRVEDGNIVSRQHNITSAEANFVKSSLSQNGADFYFVKKKTLSDTENYEIVNELDEETKLKNPYGTLWFDNKGERIVRENFAFPFGWYSPLNLIPFFPIIFKNTHSGVCNYFQIDYNYYEVKDAYFTIDKFSSIEYYTSYNNSYKDEKLLLGTIEIPEQTYYPSFDSTLNINEVCQSAITDIRHDKLINDNHQKIRFEEVCNQTNRQNLSTVFEFNKGE